MAWQKAGQTTMWDFDKNPELIGHYHSKREVTTPNGKSMIYTISGDDNTVIEFWGSTVLDRAFSDIRIKEGMPVKVVYHGKAKGKRGNTFKNFDVEFDTEGEIPVVQQDEDETEGDGHVEDVDIGTIPF